MGHALNAAAMQDHLLRELGIKKNKTFSQPKYNT